MILLGRAYQTPENFQMHALPLKLCSYVHPVPELERRKGLFGSMLDVQHVLCTWAE